MKPSLEPLISVVIPVRNRETLIVDALRSIQQQTHQNWEALVVDDGSTDNTPDVVARLAALDPRIRLLRQESSRRAQAARNVGIRAARGQWIAFLDSDDTFFPNSLEIRLEAIMKGDLLVVHSEFNCIEDDNSTRAYGMPAIKGNVYEKLLQGPNPVYQTLLVAKSALERIGYLDENIMAFQEWETVIRLAKYYPFGFVATPTFLYDCRHSDSMSKNDLLGARGYEQIFRKHFLAILLHAGPDAVSTHYKTAASWFERGGDAKAVRRCKLMAKVWSHLKVPTYIFRKIGKQFHQRIVRC